MLCHVFIVTFVTFGFLIHFQTGGLEEIIDTLVTTIAGYHTS